MSKEDKLNIMMLLSALESWGFSEKHYLPDFLHDRLSNLMLLLSAEVLNENNR